MRKNAYIAIVLLMVFTFGISCQKTPESSSVMEKKHITDAAVSTAEVSKDSIVKGDIPKSWEEEVFDEKNKIKLVFGAKIAAPENKKIPMCKYKDYLFTDETLGNYVNYFLGDEEGVKLYKFPASQKEEFERQLIDLKKARTEYEGEGDYISDETIEMLEKAIAEMPDDGTYYVEPVLDYDVSSTLESYLEDKEKGKNYLNVRIEGGKHDGACIFANNRVENHEGSTNFTFGFYNQGFDTVNFNTAISDESNSSWKKEKNQKLFHDTIENKTADTKDEAIACAEKVLEDLGLADEFSLVNIDNCIFTNSEEYEDGICSDYLGGYELNYRRNLLNEDNEDGILSLESIYSTNDNGFSQVLAMENIRIDVLNGEVRYFNYEAMHTNEGLVTDNVSIVSFEEIKEAVKKVYLYNAMTDKTHKTHDLEIVVDKISLDCRYVRDAYDDEYVYLIPVWIVEGKYNDYKPNEELYFDMDNYNVAINAIDGSNIG